MKDNRFLKHFNYDNIGNKIKSLAWVIFLIESVGSILAGFILLEIALDEKESWMVLAGLAIMISGPVISWISTWVLYGFGEIIDKLCEIERNTGCLKEGNNAFTNSSNQQNVKSTSKNTNSTEKNINAPPVEN